MKPKTSLCFLAAAIAVPVCSAAPIFSWETDTEGWFANGSNSVATSTIGATEGSQSLAVTMPNNSDVWYWNAAATVNLSPEQMQALFENATELKLDVTYPNPGFTGGTSNGWVEIIIQGANVSWTGLATREVTVEGGPQTLTFPLTVSQAAGMASGGWGQIIFRTAYANGGTTSGNVTMYIDNLTSTVVADPPPATDLYWKGDVDEKWTSLNWTSDIGGTVAGGALPADGSAGVAFSAAEASNPATLLDADQSVRSILTTAGSDLVSIGGSHSLTLGEGGIWLEETAGGLIVETTGNVVLGADQVWKNKSAGVLEVFSDISGSGVLTKSGAGSLRLGGANSHTGGTVIEQGVLSLYHTQALGGPDAALTVNGGSLDLNGLDITLGSLAGLGGGAIQNLSSTACTLTLDADSDFGYGCQINDAAGGAPVSLVKKGAGTVTSGGGGTFTGPVLIEDGRFVANTWVFNVPNWSGFGNCQTAGRTITVNSPGSLTFTNNSIFGNQNADTTLLPEIILNGATMESTRYNQIGDITLNAANLIHSSSDTGGHQGFQFKGRIKVTGDDYSIISGNGKGNHLSSDTVFDVEDATGDAFEDLVVSAPLIDQSGDYGSAPGGLTKTGEGTMLLEGENSYSGTTKVLAGVLGLRTASLNDNAGVEIAENAVLNLDHFDIDQVGGLKIGEDTMEEEGTYGALDSGADFELEQITGDGLLRLVFSTSDPFGAWIAGFTSLSGAAAEKGADPDGDGLTNIEEFALDGNPEDGADTGKVRTRVETVGSDRALVITLPVRAGATFEGAAPATASVAADGVDYEIGGSNDLVNFDQNVSEVVPALTGDPEMPALNDGWIYRTFRLDGAVGGASPRGPKGFLRASVTGTP